MTDELSQGAKDFLSLATSGQDISPSDEDRRRVRKGVGIALAAGSAAGLAASSASASAVAGSAGVAGITTGGLGLKAIVVVALVSGVVGAGALSIAGPEDAAGVGAPAASASGESSLAPSPQREQPRSQTSPIQPAPATSSALVTLEPESSAAASAEAAPHRNATARPRARAVEAEPPEVAEVEENVATMSLSDELALLRAAQRARVRGDFEEALRQLDAHARRFPEGRLAAERDGTRVFVLCDASRTGEANSAQALFLREHPTSPLAHRVRSGCD